MQLKRFLRRVLGVAHSHVGNNQINTTKPKSFNFAPKMEVSSRFRILLVTSATAVFLLVTLGAIVRVTESGLGCPDWPLCHGKIIPPFEFSTLVEYTHRVAGSLTGILIILATVIAWARYRHIPYVLSPLTLAAVLLGIEVILGGITVLTELAPIFVTVHLAIAEIIFALLLLAFIWSWQFQKPQKETDTKIYTSAGIIACVVFLVLITGSYVVGHGAGTICPGWPLCGGNDSLPLHLEWLHMSHRLLAGIGAILAVVVGVEAWRRLGSSIAIRWTSAITITIAIIQIFIGAANPWTGFSTIARVFHLSLATALWGSLVVLAALWQRPQFAKVNQHKLNFQKLAMAYITLTKPMIVVLLVITALGAMFLASEGVPPISTALLVVLGGALGAGGANAINHYLDQDIDAKMRRTRRRPLPSHVIRPSYAFYFGILLNVIAFTVLALWVNLLSAFLTIAATLFYVFVYTLWLKRRTPQGIVIGGAAGAVPPLVGWAAVTGSLDLPALYLFAIIFFWTPPHFWALAILLRKDYAIANIPMLPVVMSVSETAKRALVHSLLMIAFSMLLATANGLGWIYLTGAVSSGVVFLGLVWHLLLSGQKISTDQNISARRLYLYSLLYLFLIFILVIADSVIKL